MLYPIRNLCTCSINFCLLSQQLQTDVASWSVGVPLHKQAESHWALPVYIIKGVVYSRIVFIHDSRVYYTEIDHGLCWEWHCRIKRLLPPCFQRIALYYFYSWLIFTIRKHTQLIRYIYERNIITCPIHVRATVRWMLILVYTGLIRRRNNKHTLKCCAHWQC